MLGLLMNAMTFETKATDYQFEDDLQVIVREVFFLPGEGRLLTVL